MTFLSDRQLEGAVRQVLRDLVRKSGCSGGFLVLMRDDGAFASLVAPTTGAGQAQLAKLVGDALEGLMTPAPRQKVTN